MERGPAPSADTAPAPLDSAAGADAGVFARLGALHNKGSSSFINLSLYAFGLSGLWTAMGNPILPIKVEEIIADGGTVLWFDQKNGALAFVSLVGLAVAAIAQPITGILSDHRSGAGKRLPFLLIGTVGMATSVLFLGFVGTFVALIFVNVMVQGFGNLGQGPANALIADHVRPDERGLAAGALNLSRVAGAGSITLIVFLLMWQYDRDAAPEWLWVALVFMAVMAVAATLWTVRSLRNEPPRQYGAVSADPVPAEHVETRQAPAGSGSFNRTTYTRFLVSLAFVIAAMSALQVYSFFYLQDVIGLENPARGGVWILLATAIATGLSVIPAGKMTDTLGRDRMIYVAGALGVLAAVVLIFARSLVVVVLDGLLVGVAIGIFLTASWAVANDLVPKSEPAKYLSFTSLAVLVGSTVARLAGAGIDRLNEIEPALGYQVMLSAVAFAFFVSVLLMTNLRPEPTGPDQPGQDA